MSDLRRLPKVDVLAACESLGGYPAAVRTKAARNAISQLRESLKQGAALPDPERLALLEALQISRPNLQPVLNATGIVLHTGLGRARLAEAAADRVQVVARNHSNLELDLDSGERGDRQSHVRAMLCELTGAESALVVNNCAAAVILMLASLGRNRAVLLSRGEMVEIGGAFRMPDVIRTSGCRLVEVGCTNKTHLSDYEAALIPRVAAILRCHPSNYRVSGFAESPSDSELADLAHRQGLPFLYDLGNGCLFDLTAFGLPKEATVQSALKSGADLVTASADKLLGGPQAGLILGSVEAVRKAAKHPLARAVRIEKLTLAALEMTLRLHLEGRLDEIPTYWALSRSLEDIHRDALRLGEAAGPGAVVEPGSSEVGAGTVPGANLSTWRTGLPDGDAVATAKTLRMGEPPLVGRIERGRVWLDPRTLTAEEVELACRRLRERRGLS